MSSDFTILRWLKSKSHLLLEDDGYSTIIFDRGLDPTDYIINVEDSTIKELMTADLYMQLFFYPTQQTFQVNDQNYSKSESVQTASHDEYYDLAMAIYEAYDPIKHKLYNNSRPRVKGFKVSSNW